MWATEDGGQTWVQWGVDTDKQSPLEVELQRDGIYGFKTVVMTAKGGANTQPLPDSNADLWLQVDTTQPVLHQGRSRTRMRQGSRKSSFAGKLKMRTLVPVQYVYTTKPLPIPRGMKSHWPSPTQVSIAGTLIRVVKRDCESRSKLSIKPAIFRHKSSLQSSTR